MIQASPSFLSANRKHWENETDSRILRVSAKIIYRILLNSSVAKWTTSIVVHKNGDYNWLDIINNNFVK